MTAGGEKLLKARTEDLFELCGKHCRARFSDFLDGAEQAVIADEVVFPFGYNTLMFGGFDGAEKKMLGVFPDWQEPDRSEFPLACLRIESGFSARLTHRDYLGALMSLGIAASKLGDIVVGDGIAHVFLSDDIAGYAAENLRKIGNQGVIVTVEKDPAAVEIKRSYKTIGAVCAARRLDAVTAAAAGVSRSAAAGLISGGKVKLNYRETAKAAEPVREGDLLSVRGFGRFIVSEFGSETRSGRLHVTLKQYI